MSDTEKTTAANSTDGVDVGASGPSALAALKHADDVMLAKLGYKSEFKREFSVRSPSMHASVRTWEAY